MQCYYSILRCINFINRFLESALRTTVSLMCRTVLSSKLSRIRLRDGCTSLAGPNMQRASAWSGTGTGTGTGTGMVLLIGSGCDRRGRCMHAVGAAVAFANVAQRAHRHRHRHADVFQGCRLYSCRPVSSKVRGLSLHRHSARRAKVHTTTLQSSGIRYFDCNV